MFVLYAVLEHQTWSERLETLSTLWELLEPGGALVIIETPNRLVYQDSHTSELPFFHLLPDEIAFRYLDRVPREAFRTAMTRDLATAGVDASEKRIRWGLGASFHEFEIALAEPLEEIVVADGFEEEILNWFSVHFDEELLTRFFVERVPDKPMAFARAVLNVVLRKPRDSNDRERAARQNRARRQEITRRFVVPVREPELSNENAAPGSSLVTQLTRRVARGLRARLERLRKR